MKRFNNCTINEQVSDAIKRAELLLVDSSPMITEIRAKNDFRYDSGAGEDVAIMLLLTKKPIDVFLYKPWKFWSPVIGYFDGKAIHVNSRKLGLIGNDGLVANLLHEYAHYCGFRHGSNSPSQEKNLYSVPYYISSNIRKWLND